jgi:hypothetical protein
MTSARFAAALIGNLDIDDILGENTKKIYQDQLVRTLDSLHTNILYCQQRRKAAKADTSKYKHWCQNKCWELRDLEITLEQEGSLQQPNLPLPCVCAPDSEFCYEYENEYRMQLRMADGERPVVDLDYIFSQTQTQARPGFVMFDEVDVRIQKNVIKVAHFTSPHRAVHSIRKFVAKFCAEHVQEFIELPGSRENSPTR